MSEGEYNRKGWNKNIFFSILYFKITIVIISSQMFAVILRPRPRHTHTWCIGSAQSNGTTYSGHLYYYIPIVSNLILHNYQHWYTFHQRNLSKIYSRSSFIHTTHLWGKAIIPKSTDIINDLPRFSNKSGNDPETEFHSCTNKYTHWLLAQSYKYSIPWRLSPSSSNWVFKWLANLHFGFKNCLCLGFFFKGMAL